MELPRALAPWAPYLDLFPRELALELGPLLRRLDLVIGPMRQSSRTGSGDPDGFDGITRRGPYERLLLSEWLLAREAPDEFLRRAAMGEHTFLERAHREPAGSRVSIALFDGGPNQWGTPRIAQMAALIVLARRAEAAGAPFRWGLLQAPEGPLHTALTHETVEQLLKTHASREASVPNLRAWRTRLGRETRDDFWIVGGRRLAGWEELREASLLRIEDPLTQEPDRYLLLSITSEGRRRSDVRLELPADAVCTRLLRDPFVSAVARPSRATAASAFLSNLLFAPGGTKLLARSTNGILAYPVPNSPRVTPAKPKRYHSLFGTPVLAAGRIAKTMIAISAASQNRAFRVETFGKGYVPIVNGEYAHGETTVDFRIHASEAPLTPCFISPHSTADAAEVVLVTRHGRLYTLRQEATGYTARYDAAGIEAIAPIGTDRLAYVGQLRSQRTLFVLHREGYTSDHPLPTGSGVIEFGKSAFFGFGGLFAHPAYGLLTVRQADGRWHVLAAERELTLGPPQGLEVMGVIAAVEQKEVQPFLVVRESDLRTVALIGRDTSRFLFRTNDPTVHVTVSPFAPQIAYATVTGEVGIYSLTHGTMLYRLVGEGAS